MAPFDRKFIASKRNDPAVFQTADIPKYFLSRTASWAFTHRAFSPTSEPRQRRRSVAEFAEGVGELIEDGFLLFGNGGFDFFALGAALGAGVGGVG